MSLVFKTIFCRLQFFALSGIMVWSFMSCADGVDFDLANDIVLSPEVEVDLIFFELDGDEFSNVPIENGTLSFRDLVRLEFLDDSFVQENLVEIEIEYLVTSTYNQNIINTSRFLDNEGGLQYEFIFDIPASPDGNEVITSITEVISQNEIQAIRNSILLENELSFQLDGNPIVGKLNFRSKAIYRLIFNEL